MKRGPETKLKDKTDFEYLRDKSYRASAKYLTAYFKGSRVEKKSSRLGLSVSKKVGNAVKRNYCKRVIREMFYNSHIVHSSQDVMFVVSPRLYSENDDENIFKQLMFSFKKIEKNLLSQIQDLSV